jgi:hypothetical protein
MSGNERLNTWGRAVAELRVCTHQYEKSFGASGLLKIFVLDFCFRYKKKILQPEKQKYNLGYAKSFPTW